MRTRTLTFTRVRVHIHDLSETGQLTRTHTGLRYAGGRTFTEKAPNFPYAMTGSRYV
jgi:hypothetical protein